MTFVKAASAIPYTPYVAPEKDDTKRFMANYMASSMYKKRLASQGIYSTPDIQSILNVPINYNTKQDTQATIVKNGGQIKNSININKNQLADVKKDFNFPVSIDEAKAHELSHVSRPLSQQEQLLIAGKNKSDLGYGLFAQYQTDKSLGSYQGQYDDYKTNGIDNSNDAYHDYRPNENKADLDALRFLMQKKGIYDTSKRDMTIDDFNKASQDPEIKNSLIFNRLIQQFKPKDIISLNNTVAMNNAASPQLSAAYMV